MIVTFAKALHVYVIGQPKRGSIGQRKKVDSFIYSFLTNLSAEKTDWDSAQDIITECLLGAWSCRDVRDMEISVDIATRRYSVRFTSAVDMRDPAYAALVLWETDGKRYDECPTDPENYGIYAEPIALEDEDAAETP